MISIAVCDDNAVECLTISNRVQSCLLALGADHMIREFFDGSELLASGLSFDLVFLDIRMKRTDGLKTADLLRKRGKKFLLIFITCPRYVVIRSGNVKSYFILEIKNSREEQKTRALFVSKKTGPGRHEIGLRNIRDTVKKYHGTSDIDLRPNEFCLSLMLPD